MLALILLPKLDGSTRAKFEELSILPWTFDECSVVDNLGLRHPSIDELVGDYNPLLYCDHHDDKCSELEGKYA